MSVNTSHIGDGKGVVIFNGECNIIYCTGIELKLEAQIQYERSLKEGYYPGCLYLTTHRLIFIGSNIESNLLSLNMPHIFLHDIKVRKTIGKYPVLSGELEAEPFGGFHGRLPFKLIFQKGGAIEFEEALKSIAIRSLQAARNWKPGALFKSHHPTARVYKAPRKVYFDVHKDPLFQFVRRHIAFELPSERQIFMYKSVVPYPGFFECISTEQELNLAVPLEPEPLGRGKAYRNPTVYNTYWTPCQEPPRPDFVCHDESNLKGPILHYRGPFYSGPTARKVSGRCECKQLKWEIPDHCKPKNPCPPVVNGIPVLCGKYTMVHMCRTNPHCHSNVATRCE